MIKAYKDLSYLEGQHVEFLRGFPAITTGEDGFRLPDDCVILKDYPNTVLLDLIYIESPWGTKEPRHIKKLAPKGMLATGQILLKGNVYLVGEEIGEMIEIREEDYID